MITSSAQIISTVAPGSGGGGGGSPAGNPGDIQINAGGGNFGARTLVGRIGKLPPAPTITPADGGVGTLALGVHKWKATVNNADAGEWWGNGADQSGETLPSIEITYTVTDQSVNGAVTITWDPTAFAGMQGGTSGPVLFLYRDDGSGYGAINGFDPTTGTLTDDGSSSPDTSKTPPSTDTSFTVFFAPWDDAEFGVAGNVEIDAQELQVNASYADFTGKTIGLNASTQLNLLSSGEVNIQSQTLSYLSTPNDSVQITEGVGVTITAEGTGNMIELNITRGITISNSASGKIGFFATTPVAKQTVAGVKLPSDTVMASLLAALVAYGLVIDSTT